jgi:hypothetical protein
MRRGDGSSRGNRSSRVVGYLELGVELYIVLVAGGLVCAMEVLHIFLIQVARVGYDV